MNKLLKSVSVLLSIIFFTSCMGNQEVTADYNVIPLPNEINSLDGDSYVLNSPTPIIYSSGNIEMKENAFLLSSYLKKATGLKFTLIEGDVNVSGIRLLLEPTANPESYELDVNKNGITILGGSPAGVFYGMQTIRKAIPAHSKESSIIFPSVKIKDAPRFAYRGMMLDVSRHFFPVDSVKSFIDILALHNVNRMHWHLSDDQGWRIEIKKYPELTQIGSKRKQTVLGRNSGEYDNESYEGFYTQEQIKDIVEYAKKRFITIIPEIDLPGHQQAALATYPELGCTGGPYEVWTQWGISDDVICAGNDKSIAFLKDVLSEVIDLFPSQYIHVGGDECPKVRWEKCPKCQARIREQGIKGDDKHSATEYLQSYVIGEMEKFVESKGRHIIGWDEILEGGLTPNATVMSWRGVAGGIEAATQKHNVIMTPNSYLYFDYYQSTDTDREPLAIGGYLPLEKVYSFEPTDGIPSEYQKYVMGVQANLWTEYIPTFSQVEYMVLPRLAALSETQWSNAGKKDYKKFLPRLVKMQEIYDDLGYNYGKHIYDVNASFSTNTSQSSIDVELKTFGGGEIYYTLDGTEPTSGSKKYKDILSIDSDATVKACVIRPNYTSRVFIESVIFSKSTAKPLTLKEEPSNGYKFNGGPELNDGLSGNDNYKTGRWLGFQGKNVDAVIDLQKPTEISKVKFNTNVVKGDWIMGAAGVTVKVSEDGKTFKEVATKKIPSLNKEDKDGIYTNEISFNPVNAKYVEVIINSDKLPSWHGGAGNNAFLFVDEIILD